MCTRAAHRSPSCLQDKRLRQRYKLASRSMESLADKGH